MISLLSTRLHKTRLAGSKESKLKPSKWSPRFDQIYTITMENQTVYKITATLGLFKCIVSDLFFYNNQKSATSVFVIPTSVLVISCKSVCINTKAIKEINHLRSKGMSRAAL